MIAFLVSYAVNDAEDAAQDNRNSMQSMESVVAYIKNFIKTQNILPSQQDLELAFRNSHYEIYSTPPLNYPFSSWPQQTLNYAVGIWNGDNMDYYDSFLNRYTYQAADTASKVIVGLWPGFLIGLFLTGFPWACLLWKRIHRGT